MKMKQIGKKLTATLLSAAMIFTMGTTAAFAGTNTDSIPSDQKTTVNKSTEAEANAFVTGLQNDLEARTDLTGYSLVYDIDPVHSETGTTETINVTGTGATKDEAEADAKEQGENVVITKCTEALTCTDDSPRGDGKQIDLTFTFTVPKNRKNIVTINVSAEKVVIDSLIPYKTHTETYEKELTWSRSSDITDYKAPGTYNVDDVFLLTVASIGKEFPDTPVGTYQFTITSIPRWEITSRKVTYVTYSSVWTANGYYTKTTYPIESYDVTYSYKNGSEYVKVLPDPPAEHKHTLSGWLTDSTHHWKECTDPNCPDKEYNIVYIQDKDEHVDKNSDGECDTCGYKVPVTPPAHTKHTYTLKNDNLYHWYACTGCTANYGKALHTYGAWTITKYPTTYSRGIASHTCTVCDYVETIRFRYDEYIPGYPYWPDYDNGGKLNGWKDLSKGTVYYENGVKLTGWQKIDGETYYFDENGYLCYGWLKLSGKWYYLDPTTGARQYEWLRLKNTWYYLTPGTGVMYANGEYNIDGARYYFFDWGGMMETNWLDAPEGWKYFRGNGAMAKSAWIEWKGEYYYVASDGVMLTDAYTPDGYYVNKDGVWVH